MCVRECVSVCDFVNICLFRILMCELLFTFVVSFRISNAKMERLSALWCSVSAIPIRFWTWIGALVCDILLAMVIRLAVCYSPAIVIDALNRLDMAAMVIASIFCSVYRRDLHCV